MTRAERLTIDLPDVFTFDKQLMVRAANAIEEDARAASEREKQLRDALVGALATIVALGLSGDRPQAERYAFAHREADALEALLKRTCAADPPASLETPNPTEPTP